MTLRHRILLTLAPLLVLLAVVGSAGVALLMRLGNSANAILRENYDSVIAMEQVHEALERIDSSFQFALNAANDEGLRERARRQFDENRKALLASLAIEQGNITLPGEGELADRLAELAKPYLQRGEEFHDRLQTAGERREAYFGQDGAGGLLESFGVIKDVSGRILRLNQNYMEEAGREAQRIAMNSLNWLGAGLAAALVLAGLSAWHTVRTILRPVQSVTRAAVGISEGNLDQIVSTEASDELGQLAQSFNTMAHRLRDFRQSQTATLLRAQQTIQATIDSFPDPVLVIDFEGIVETANPAARRLLGVLPRQGDRSLAAGIWQPPEALREPLAAALEGRGDFLPEGFDRTILLGSAGRERALLPRILTIRDPAGNALGAAVLLQDVSRLRLLDQIKSNLVATASHELKTPLTSVRLALHLLLEETVGPLSPKQLELLIDARDNCERLLTMVNNLLDLAQLEHGARQIDVRPESPQDLLQAAADAIRPRADEKGLEIGCDVPQGLPLVAVDATRLGHALRNLLENALTYTDRGGKLTLSARADADGVEFSVADTGLGIPAEHLSHVFEKFFRVPGQSRGSGTGLGLAIVHEIVTAHGGEITCESTPGVGTTFRMRLPRTADEERRTVNRES